MAQNQAKFSERMSALVRVDVAALSPKARAWPQIFPLPIATQATTAYRNIPIVNAMKVTAVSINFQTLPAVSGGTDTLQLDYLSSSGATPIVVVTAVTTLSGLTANSSQALTLAATNPTTMIAGSLLRLARITSNNTVGTADAGGMMNVVLQPIEDTTISD